MSAENLVGTSLGGYELRALIGSGGMGAVYRAHQARLARDVAVKVLPPHLSAQDSEYAERFETEAKTAAALEHAHIIPVYDYGQQNDYSYVVMRLLTGGSLADRLTHSTTPPSLREIAAFVRQIASALDYAHSFGVIHRDIKASNIMFDARGEAFVVDFGIAKLLNATNAITGTGVAMGTPAYMSPEQWRGLDITPAVDQYALGVLVYQMMTGGRLPFQADTPYTLMHKHMNETPPPLQDWRQDLPVRVANVVARALEKNPVDRFPSCGAFAAALEEAVANTTGQQTGFFTAPLPRKPGVENAQPTDDQPTSRPEIAPGAGTPASQAVGPRTVTPGSAASLPPPIPMQESQRTPFRNPVVWALAITVLLLGGLVAFMLGGQIMREAEAEAQRLLAAELTQVYHVTQTALAPTATATPSATATPTATFTPSATATPTATFTPSHTPTVTLTPSDTPEPTASFTPSPIPTPGRLRQLLTRANWVTRVVYHPDGERLAVASTDGRIRYWQIDIQGQLSEMNAEMGAIWGLAFNPNGATLAAGGANGDIQVWLPSTTSMQMTTLSGHTGLVLDLAYNRAGNRLASAGEDGTVRLWDLDMVSEIAALTGHVGAVTAVDFSPDGTQIVSAGIDGTVRLWDVNSGASTVLRGHTMAVWSVAYHPTESYIVSGGDDTTIRLWDVATGASLDVLEGHTDSVFTVTFSPDGTLLASGGADEIIRIWDVAAGQTVLITSLRGTDNSPVLSLSFHPTNSSLLASGAEDGTWATWRIRGDIEIQPTATPRAET